MKETISSRFHIDNASILFLSLMRKDHCNSFRFTMTLTEPVCPRTLQNAVDRVYRRFPTVIAGFQPGLFQYYQIPVQTAPQVREDPGMLITMSREEIRNCAFRVYYQQNAVSVEYFHALADGYGAIICISTIVSEYLRLKHGISIRANAPLLDPAQEPVSEETEDAFLNYSQAKPKRLPRRNAYQLPGGELPRDAVHVHTVQLPVRKLLDFSRSHGISVTTLISAVMAASAMELQKRHAATGKIRPVRIMVPADLRRMFPSRTLRNFVLYVLPTLEPNADERDLPAILRSFGHQMQNLLTKEQLAGVMAYNVRTQRSWYFRMIPMAVKLAIMRLVYRFFGECTNTITVTNLGNVRLPEEMQSYVENFEVTLTPRTGSPYNCSVLSFNDRLSIRISRFPRESELEAIFCEKLDSLLAGV